jgi:hypothetical protein
MNDREEIRKRVQAFKAYQDRPTRERDIRMDKLVQQMRRTLAEMRENAGPPLTPKD